jgi:hypothetical protein
MNILSSNEEPSAFCQDQGARRWCRNYLNKKKKRSIDYRKKIYIVSSQECCIQKTLIITQDYLKEQDDKMCMKFTEESHPCSSTLVLSHLTIQITPNVTQRHQGVLEGRTYSIWGISLYLSSMAHGLHFTCAVIYME